MPTPAITSTTTTVWDAKADRTVPVIGAGSLKGRLTLKDGIDLTKPIFEQVMRDEPPIAG